MDDTMVYRKGAAMAPILTQWAQARIALGEKPVNAYTVVRRVSAMANSLGVSPEHLPDNAVALHFAGRTAKSAGIYDVALDQFRRWTESEGRVAAWAGRSPFLPASDAEDPEITAWREHMSRLSPATVRSYVSSLLRVMGYAGKDRARDLTAHDVEDYLADRKSRAKHCKGREPRAGYTTQEVGNVHRFFEYLAIAALRGGPAAPVDPTLLVKRVDVKTPPVLPIPIADLETLALAAEGMACAPDDPTAALGRRWRAALILMADNGFRISDVMAFRPRDVHHTDTGWKVNTTGKNHRDQAPVPIVASDSVVAEFVSSGDWALTESVLPTSWTSERASQAFIAFARQCGVRSHAHALRHFYGTTYLTARGNTDSALMELKAQMRHEDINTTLRYAHYVESAARNKMIASVGSGLFTARSARHPLYEGRSNRGGYARAVSPAPAF